LVALPNRKTGNHFFWKRFVWQRYQWLERRRQALLGRLVKAGSNRKGPPKRVALPELIGLEGREARVVFLGAFSNRKSGSHFS
jgi:hypothetical protein